MHERAVGLLIPHCLANKCCSVYAMPWPILTWPAQLCAEKLWGKMGRQPPARMLAHARVCNTALRPWATLQRPLHEELAQVSPALAPAVRGAELGILPAQDGHTCQLGPASTWLVVRAARGKLQHQQRGRLVSAVGQRRRPHEQHAWKEDTVCVRAEGVAAPAASCSGPWACRTLPPAAAAWLPCNFWERQSLDMVACGACSPEQYQGQAQLLVSP